MVCGKTERGEHLEMSLNEEILEGRDYFKYFESILSKNCGFVEEGIHRVNEGQNLRCYEQEMES